MRKFGILAAAAAVATLAVLGDASASGANDDVLDALDALPAGVLRPWKEDQVLIPGETYAAIVSPRAARSVMALDERASRRLGAFSSLVSTVSQALLDPAPWQAAVGVGLEGISAVTTFRSRSQERLLWALPDADAAARMVEGLRARGFAPGEGGWLVNGDLDRYVNPRQRSGTNPFRGHLGSSYAVRQDGRLVWQTPSLDPLPGATPLEPFYAEARAALRSASQGLTLVQAVVVTLPVEMPDGAKAILAGDEAGQVTIEAIQARHEAERLRSAEASRTAIPFVPLAILADFEAPGSAGRRGALLVLPYEDCALARTAVARFPARWKATTALEHEGFTTSIPKPDADATAALAGGAATCSAVLRLTAPATADGGFENPVFAFLHQAAKQPLSGPLAMAVQ